MPKLTVAQLTLLVLCASLVLAAAFFMVQPSHAKDAVDGASKADQQFFEMRTYTASPGKLDALNKRFRDHTLKLFVKHGMTNIGYWTAADGDRAGDTLVYILAYPSREARDASWAAFKDDPEWKTAKAASEADGTPLAAKVESVFLTPTDYSPLR